MNRCINWFGFVCPLMKVIDGWPCISESLKWTQGCPLYLMGQYTALQVGLQQRVLVIKNSITNNLSQCFTMFFPLYRLDHMQ